MPSLLSEPDHDRARLFEAALVVWQACGVDGTSSVPSSFVLESASKEPRVDTEHDRRFASKVKEASGAGRVRVPVGDGSTWRELLGGPGRHRLKVPR